MGTESRISFLIYHSKFWSRVWFGTKTEPQLKTEKGSTLDSFSNLYQNICFTVPYTVYFVRMQHLLLKYDFFWTTNHLSPLHRPLHRSSSRAERLRLVRGSRTVPHLVTGWPSLKPRSSAALLPSLPLWRTCYWSEQTQRRERGLTKITLLHFLFQHVVYSLYPPS